MWRINDLEKEAVVHMKNLITIIIDYVDEIDSPKDTAWVKNAEKFIEYIQHNPLQE